MSYTDWKDKTSDFKKIDVRGIQGNFFQGIKKHAINTEVGSGLEIVQSFDPIPLYDVMEGFDFYTMARYLYTNPQLLGFKLFSMANRGYNYNFHIPPKSTFLA